MFVTQKTIAKAIIMLVAIFLLSTPSFSAEKEIKIGYSLGSAYPNSVNFYFNVPVTKEMIDVIEKQDGISEIFPTHGKYDLTVFVGKMFSPKEVISNIIKALETKIFIDKPVKAYPVEQ